MLRPPIPFRDLIAESWKQFIQDWKQTLEISIWFLLPSLVVFVDAVLEPLMKTRALANAVSFFFGMGGTLLTFFIALRLERFVLRKDLDRSIRPADMKPVTSELYLSFLWVAFLELLAVVGGFFAFILPGIWLGVSLMFSRYFFLEDGLRGMHALRASHAIVKGRWRQVFWIALGATLVFSFVLVFGKLALAAVIAIFAGMEKAYLLLRPTAAAMTDPLFAAMRHLMQAILQVVFIPLFVTWQAKLFHALKTNRR